MTKFWRLPFDKSYIILAIGVFLTYFVPIRMRVGPVMIVPFVMLWFIVNLCRGEKAMTGFMRRFLAFFVPLALFFGIRAFLFGYGEYDGVPFRRHILYSGLVMVYLYIFHYLVSRGKIRELRMLNFVILAVLAFGAFQSRSFEIGQYRDMGVVAGTSRETFANTIERLETASSGISNYGDIYAMVFINVALLAICRYVAIKWKCLYVLIVLLFSYGIYKGAYTTALLVGLIMGFLVMAMQVLKIKRRAFKMLLFAFAVFFVFVNALQAMGAGKASFILSVCRQCVLYMPLMFVFNHLWGEYGIVWALPAAELLSLLQTVIIYGKIIFNPKYFVYSE